MLTDAHCHPRDLFLVSPQAEKERRETLSARGERGVTAAASAWQPDEFAYNAELSHNAAGAAALLLCFAVHPQLPAVYTEKSKTFKDADLSASMEFLYKTAEEKKLSAVGETGFDLFNSVFRETEKTQEKIFQAHLTAALNFDLPVVIHTRRAINKIFSSAKILAKCKAVIFHSWPGTRGEAISLLKRGVNAYFSFGNTITLNHKQAESCCAALPADRLLTETDAPYQPRRGLEFSHWKDLPYILEKAALLRTGAGNPVDIKDLESQVEINFKKAFGLN